MTVLLHINVQWFVQLILKLAIKIDRHAVPSIVTKTESSV
jgi:hypothetical protein